MFHSGKIDYDINDARSAKREMLADAVSLYFATALTPAAYVFAAVCSQNIKANLLVFWIVSALVAATCAGVMMRSVDCDGVIYRGTTLVAIVDYGNEECRVRTTRAVVFVVWMFATSLLAFASVYYATISSGSKRVYRASNLLVHHTATHGTPTLAECALLALSVMALRNVVSLGTAPIPGEHAIGIAALLGCATWSGERTFAHITSAAAAALAAHGAVYTEECGDFFSYTREPAECDDERTAVRALLVAIAASSVFRLCGRGACLS